MPRDLSARVPATWAGRTRRHPVGASLDVEAHRTHQFECIAVCNDPLPKSVVEGHSAVHHLVLEVDVLDSTRLFAGEFGQRQVVCGDDADGGFLKETPHQHARPDPSIV